MNNELMIKQILVQQGLIEFFQFDELKEQASLLADHIKAVEVNDENLKESKKLLAAVNKKVKELEDQRIMIKKAMLEPYQAFEDQVKEIVSIVKEADEIVRLQVKQLEEAERQGKQAALEDLFSKRIIHYSFRDLISFKDFLQPKHLNKTTKIEAVEKEMIDFLEKITRDLKAIEKMPSAEAVLSAYIDVKDLAAAITLVQQKEQRKAQIEASKAIKQKDVYVFTVFEAKDFKLLKIFMEQNEIKFVSEMFNIS